MSYDSDNTSLLMTISEVAGEVGVAQHVLRFWESKFSQIKPLKIQGRRYYKPADINIICMIKNLLHNDGYTIKGVQKHLKNSSASGKKVAKLSLSNCETATHQSSPDVAAVENVLVKLKKLQSLLEEI